MVLPKPERTVHLNVLPALSLPFLLNLSSKPSVQSHCMPCPVVNIQFNCWPSDVCICREYLFKIDPPLFLSDTRWALIPLCLLKCGRVWSMPGSNKSSSCCQGEPLPAIPALEEVLKCWLSSPRQKIVSTWLTEGVGGTLGADDFCTKTNPCRSDVYHFSIICSQAAKNAEEALSLMLCTDQSEEMNLMIIFAGQSLHGAGNSLKAYILKFQNVFMQLLERNTPGKVTGGPGNAFELVYGSITEVVRQKMHSTDPTLCEWIRCHHHCLGPPLPHNIPFWTISPPPKSAKRGCTRAECQAIQ